MKSHARAVVIGGGITGCSMLYQLTRQGWTDVVLIEKGELTSGSTWHAAGQVPFYSETPFFSRLHKASFDIYEEVERETGTPVGLHRCGSLRIARTADEMLEYKRYMANTRDLGIEDAPEPVRGAHEGVTEYHIGDEPYTMTWKDDAEIESLFTRFEGKEHSVKKNGEWVSMSKGEMRDFMRHYAVVAGIEPIAHRVVARACA